MSAQPIRTVEAEHPWLWVVYAAAAVVAVFVSAANPIVFM